MKHVSAIMLAGTILPTPFQEALGLPMLCLPVGRSGSMLDAWARMLGSVESLEQVKLVVRTQAELTTVQSLRRWRSGDGPVAIDVMRDPGAWRGVAGLLRDLCVTPDGAEIVIVCEAHCYPPRTLEPLLESLADDAIKGVVGTTERGEPAGVYAFRRSVFESVSPVGYCDLKEQLLPQLYERGVKVVARSVSERVQRIRDLDSYLSAARSSLMPGDAEGGFIKRVSPRAKVSPSAMLEGFCIIEPNAVIEDGAVVHESVVLSGAVVGGGAVVSRSVVGPRVRVRPRSQMVHEALPTPAGVLDDVIKGLEAEAGATPAA